MAKATTQITQANDGELFILKRVESNGKETVSTEHANKALDNKTTATNLNKHTRSFGQIRDTFLSLLSQIMASPKLDGYKGKGDVTQGKLTALFKESMRSAEEAHFQLLLDKKLITLEKNDNPDEAFRLYVQTVRKDKNYEGLKATVSKYFVFCGALNVTPSGYLVPVAVMQEHIKNVLQLEPADQSINGQLNAVCEAMQKVTMTDDDVRNSLTTARMIVATLEGIKNHQAELATAKAQAMPPVPEATQQVINAVMAKADAHEAKADGKRNNANVGKKAKAVA